MVSRKGLTRTLGYSLRSCDAILDARDKAEAAGEGVRVEIHPALDRIEAAGEGA